ncbi:MAG: hypothetical protein JF584_14040 [Acidobacteria bacterium]|nr:hypothetical protein [Acidobacteriota bacterium]
MPLVESFLNLAWFAIAVAMVSGVWIGVFTGKLSAPMGRALTATVMVAFLLLPVISITDDMQVLRKLTEPEDLTMRRHYEGVTLEFELLCLEMLCLVIALSFVLRRLQVLARPDTRVRRFLNEDFALLMGVRPPPAAVL